MTDEQFFQQHPDRFSHIREPSQILQKTKRRGMQYALECEREFRSLGSHNKDRRRILLWRVPPSHPLWDPKKERILKIPFLLFADETVEDRDDILLPIIKELMTDAAKNFVQDDMRHGLARH